MLVVLLFSRATLRPNRKNDPLAGQFYNRFSLVGADRHGWIRAFWLAYFVSGLEVGNGY